MQGDPTSLLLECHQDDAILFSSWNVIRFQPLVVTVLSDARGQEGVTADERNRENREAVMHLGLGARDVWPWPYSDADPDWDAIRDDLEIMARQPEPGRGHLRTSDYGSFERVFAPAPEPKNGHPQHDRLGQLAGEVFGERVIYYTTYRTGGPRTTGTPVPYEREWVLLKLRALACFESQIRRGPVRFFTHSLEEWTRP